MGDADVFDLMNLPPAGNQNNNNATPGNLNGDRILSYVDVLLTRKECLVRRRAAEALRVAVTRHYRQNLQNQIVEVVFKILRKTKEDQVVLEQILWAVTNLSCETCPIVHALQAKGIVKLLAKHAINMASPSVRDQAVWSLSNFAADCDQCRIAVRKTKIADFIINILKTPAFLTNKQRSLYTWTLRNIFRPTKGDPNVSIVVSYGT